MSLIGCEIVSSVATLTLKRDRVRNALNRPLLAELHEVLDRLQHKASGVRALVLTGSGTAFCSGVDLHSRRYLDSRGPSEVALRDPTMLILWYPTERISISDRVGDQGPAVGAGMSLAVATDIIVASEDAYFPLVH